MKVTGCEGRENISTLKLIMEDPGKKYGEVELDNVIESRFMSCEIERIPPLTYITHLILANGHCIGRSLHKPIHDRRVI